MTATTGKRCRITPRRAPTPLTSLTLFSRFAMKKMFFLLPLFLTAALSLSAQADAVTRFFDRYIDDERFTVVYVSPKLFQMVSRIKSDDPDWETVQSVLKDLGGLRVLTADSITDGVALYKEALGKVPVSEYTELVTVRDGKENVRIWTKDKGNIIEELLLLVGSPDQFTLLSFTGKIDLEKISSLSNAFDIDGMEQLGKVGSKKKSEKPEEKKEEPGAKN